MSLVTSDGNKEPVTSLNSIDSNKRECQSSRSIPSIKPDLVINHLTWEVRKQVIRALNTQQYVWKSSERSKIKTKKNEDKCRMRKLQSSHMLIKVKYDFFFLFSSFYSNPTRQTFLH